MNARVKLWPMRMSTRWSGLCYGCVMALALTGTAPAQAARPLITDDARVVDPGACQVESWVKRNRDSTEYWALPACNFTGSLELTFGGARTRDSDRSYASDIQAQGKLLLRPLEINGVGIAVVAGTVRHLQPDARDWFIYAPISVSLLDDLFPNRQSGECRHGQQ